MRTPGAKNKIPAQGRKKEFKTFSISCTPEEAEKLKALAEKNNKSVSRLVIDSLLN